MADSADFPVAIPRHRFAFLPITALSFGLAAASAAGPAPTAAPTITPELRQLAEQEGISLEIPAWEVSGELELGAGHQDNVLLAPLAPEASSLVRANLNTVALGFHDAFETIAFVDATFTHFLAAGTDDAQLVIARAEERWQPRERWQFSLAGQYILQNEVTDASTLESGLGSVLARLDRFSLAPAVRWTPSRAWEATLELSFAANDFRPPLDDFDDARAELGLARDFERWGKVTLAYAQLARDFRDRTQAAIGGRPLEGTELATSQGEGSLRYAVEGGEQRRWRVRLAGGLLQYRDNGSGWYDFDRGRIEVAASVEAGPWRLEAESGWRRYVYGTQTAGYGIDPPRRKRTDWLTSLRVERAWGENFAAFASIEYERSRSNDFLLEFENTLVIAGVRLSR